MPGFERTPMPRASNAMPDLTNSMQSNRCPSCNSLNTCEIQGVYNRELMGDEEWWWYCIDCKDCYTFEWLSTDD